MRRRSRAAAGCAGRRAGARTGSARRSAARSRARRRSDGDSSIRRWATWRPRPNVIAIAAHAGSSTLSNAAGYARTAADDSTRPATKPASVAREAASHDAGATTNAEQSAGERDPEPAGEIVRPELAEQRGIGGVAAGEREHVVAIPAMGLRIEQERRSGDQRRGGGGEGEPARAVGEEQRDCDRSGGDHGRLLGEERQCDQRTGGDAAPYRVRIEHERGARAEQRAPGGASRCARRRASRRRIGTRRRTGRRRSRPAPRA